VLILDLGEAEAILLAEEVDCRFLLIDERKGRAIAKRRGARVVGTAGILLAAKKRVLIDTVLPVLTNLERAGYRMSTGLTNEITRLAGEDG
jgi:predicted nucleic acid-binding protein